MKFLNYIIAFTLFSAFIFIAFEFTLIVAIILSIGWFASNNYKAPSDKPEDLYSSETQLANFLNHKRIYMKSIAWKEKRLEALSTARYMCQSCGIDNASLEIHHLSGYNRIPNEKPSDLVCLCRACHQMQHDHYGYPLTYEDYMQWNVPLLTQK